MLGLPLLTIMTFIPLVGVLVLLSIRGNADITDQNAKMVALYTSGFNFALSVYLFLRYDPAGEIFQFQETYPWLSSLGIDYHVGIDGISLIFVVLSAFLTPICILASWTSITSRVKEYMAAFLLLEMFMIGTFVALDSVLFYIFFEGVLIPMFLIIGIWGGKERIYASYKFFLYTLLGSVLMLLAMLGLYSLNGTTNIPQLLTMPVPTSWQIWFFLAFFASFAVKIPMWPFHTWLPDAHVQAPTAGSVILAGVLLKMGGYGFLRFSVPMMPEATQLFTPYIFSLSVIAIIYASLVALAQQDMKKMIAYSSVAHMGYVTLGIFSLTPQGMEGAIFQMLSHGIISGALFLCVGVLYDRLHTRDLSSYGGIVQNMPHFCVLLFIFVMGSVGLPGTSGFIGEFLALQGTFIVSGTFAALGTLGVILGAIYMLKLYRCIAFGPGLNRDALAMPDLERKEYITLVPLALLTIILGVYPALVMDKVAPSALKVIELYDDNLEKTRLNDAAAGLEKEEDAYDHGS